MCSGIPICPRTRGRFARKQYGCFIEADAGAFSELGLGFGLERFAYGLSLPSAPASDYVWNLLARFGFGIYFGGEDEPRGEAQVYYDHRHDEFTGGFPGAFFVGTAGHVGLDARIHLGEGLGLRGELEAGSGFLGGVSLLVSQGGVR